MNNQRLAVVVIAAVGMLGTFMPWVNIPIVGSVNGTKGDGWITFFIFAIPLLLNLLSEKTLPLSINITYITIAAGVTAAGFAVWKIIDFNRSMPDVDKDNPFAKMLSSTVSVGFGLYLIAIAGIAMAGVAIALKSKGNTPGAEPPAL
jgi:hypothetical protein